MAGSVRDFTLVHSKVTRHLEALFVEKTSNLQKAFGANSVIASLVLALLLQKCTGNAMADQRTKTPEPCPS